MRKFVLLFLGFLFLTSLSVICQEKTDDPDQLVLPKSTENTGDVVKNDVKPKRLSTGFDVGTSFTYSKGNFFGPSYYVAPHLNYQLSPRLLLSAGVSVERSNFHTLYEQPAGESDILPMTRAFIYGRGSYLLSDRLTVSGTVYKAINDVPRLTRYSAPLNYNYQGASLEFNYKITNSISFGVQVRTQNGSQTGFGYYSPQNFLMAPGL